MGLFHFSHLTITFMIEKMKQAYNFLLYFRLMNYLPLLSFVIIQSLLLDIIRLALKKMRKCNLIFLSFYILIYI